MPPIVSISSASDYELLQMASAGQVRAGRMFGGYGIYLAEHFVAIVLNEKPIAENEPYNAARV